VAYYSVCMSFGVKELSWNIIFRDRHLLNFVYVNYQYCILTVMNFNTLIQYVGDLPWFDLATVMQLSGENRASVVTQLSRWIAADKVISVRRGMYVLGENYRKKPLQPAALANAVYSPSYLSCLFALSFYGIIPESVPVYTSVTTRKPQTFENRFGTFEYRNIKRDLFFGYTVVMITAEKVRMAIPEKALVDYWHLSRGEWTKQRLQEMRFSPESPINLSMLAEIVNRFDKPRISRAYQRLVTVLRDAEEGIVEI
jgi:hypothetical protein